MWLLIHKKKNHEIIELFGLEESLKIPFPSPVPLKQVAQSSMQPGQEHFQGWSINHRVISVHCQVREHLLYIWQANINLAGKYFMATGNIAINLKKNYLKEISASKIQAESRAIQEHLSFFSQYFHCLSRTSR